MNTPQHDGGPEFPTLSASVHLPHHGMSLRDWFAGMAMQGNLASQRPGYNYGGTWRDLADESYIIADAMLAARNQNQADQ